MYRRNRYYSDVFALFRELACRSSYPQALVLGLTAKFDAVLVTGPRQAGKTSLLEHMTAELFGDAARSIAFDTPSEIAAFRRDPDLFFLNHPGVLFLDEVQHVPDLFPYLKRELDRTRRVFRFFLSGSQHFELMKGVTESLAGRVAVLDLWPLAVQEVHGKRPAATVELLENPTRLDELLGREIRATDQDDIVPAMLAGGYPPVVLQRTGADWLEAYRRTYVQRDVRELSQVADLGRFDRFSSCAPGAPVRSSTRRRSPQWSASTARRSTTGFRCWKPAISSSRCPRTSPTRRSGW
jgi:hypothetical protein